MLSYPVASYRQILFQLTQKYFDRLNYGHINIVELIANSNNHMVVLASPTISFVLVKIFDELKFNC